MCSEYLCKSLAAFKTAALIVHHTESSCPPPNYHGKKAGPDGLTRQITHPASTKPWLRNFVNYPQLRPFTRKKKTEEREGRKKNSNFFFMGALKLPIPHRDPAVTTYRPPTPVSLPTRQQWPDSLGHRSIEGRREGEGRPDE